MRPSRAARQEREESRAANGSERRRDLLAAGNSDQSYAQIANARAQSQPVKDYVARITRDNATVNQLVNDVMTRMQTSPVENAASLEYRDESAMNRDMLRDLQGSAFDNAYMMNEVSAPQRGCSPRSTTC